MTKRVYIIIALTLCLALLAGCAASASAPSAAVEPTATPSPTATPEPPSTRPDPTAVPEKNGMYELLSGVFDNYHFGTAGSSLICAWYAASIVDWGVKNGGSAVVNGARAWDRGPETEFGESFEDKLASVYAAALSLYGAGTGILDDCGWQGEWTYSAADVRAVFEPLFPALGMSPPFAVRVYYPDGDLMYLRVQGMVLDRSETVDITQTLNTVLAGYVFNDGAGIKTAALENGRWTSTTAWPRRSALTAPAASC